MNFEIVQLNQFAGSHAGIYSIYLEDEQQTLFEHFITENSISFKREIKDIVQRLKTINFKTGAREQFFKQSEGNPGDGICALYDKPESNLRLYCIRFGSGLLILGGGGYKPKNIRTFQENRKLKDENYLLREIAKKNN